MLIVIFRVKIYKKIKNMLFFFIYFSESLVYSYNLTMNITCSYYNYFVEAPVVLTHPHFMNADQIYKDTVDGLRNDTSSEEHGTFIEVEPVR